MIDQLLSELTGELQAFQKLAASSSIPTITDSYDRILAIVQSLMLTNDNPDAHARAWSLLTDDAFKDLSDIQEGKPAALPELKHKLSTVGELLTAP